ncbi:MAG: ATP-binding protein [Longimicrobiales bacterium]
MQQEVPNRRRFDDSTDRYVALLRVMTTIVWDMPASGEFQRGQPGWAAFTGQRFAEYRGSGWLEAVHPEDRAGVKSMWSASVARPSPIEAEHRLRRHDGEYCYVCMCAVPIFEESGARVVEWIGSHTDITSRKQTELSLRNTLAELETANRDLGEASDAKSTFLATMSHELRTPLNALIGYSELLLLGIPGELPATIRPPIERIDLSARHLLQLIEEILTFSRIEAGRERLHYELVELHTVMREVIAVMEPTTTTKGLLFQVDLPSAPVEVVTDPRKIRQILGNLLGNAVKFTARGSITLRARVRDDMLVLEVTDTGIGIARDHLEKIFDPFWQADHGKTRAIGGTGLGLAVTRELAFLLGGTVDVTSAPGKGTRFTVRLPITEPGVEV